MKISSSLFFYFMAITGVFFFIISSCKKDQQDTFIVKDVDGNVYNTIAIGTQIWMVENLKVTKYRNGDLIGTTTPDTLDISKESSPKYQWIYNYSENDSIHTLEAFGRLYTWYAVTDSRGVCPSGWHIPDDTEWTILADYLGGNSEAGGKLKETGIIHWDESNNGATNQTGFTAVPGGTRLRYGYFIYIGLSGFWWSSTQYYSKCGITRQLVHSDSLLYWCAINKRDGCSVRCIKD